MIYNSRNHYSMNLAVNGQSDLELVRPMVYSDLTEVMNIEQQVTHHPWHENSFAEVLNAKYGCWVIESNSQVIAYLVQSICIEESHILNLAVTSSRQGQGLGRGLVRKACADAAESGVVKILLEVRPNNLIARQLYESEGFLVFGRRHNYYRSSDCKEDALVMARDLEPSSVMTT